LAGGVCIKSPVWQELRILLISVQVGEVYQNNK
jgi:hypothetical protein